MIFYVGTGCGDRVYVHVWAAMGAAELIQDVVERESQAVRSAKIDMIQDILGTSLAELKNAKPGKKWNVHGWRPYL